MTEVKEKDWFSGKIDLSDPSTMILGAAALAIGAVAGYVANEYRQGKLAFPSFPAAPSQQQPQAQQVGQTPMPPPVPVPNSPMPASAAAPAPAAVTPIIVDVPVQQQQQQQNPPVRSAEEQDKRIATHKEYGSIQRPSMRNGVDDKTNSIKWNLPAGQQQSTPFKIRMNGGSR